LVNGDISAVKLLAIHLLDSLQHGILFKESHETETPGPSGLTIRNDLARRHLAEWPEGILQTVVCGGPCKATHEASVFFSHVSQHKKTTILSAPNFTNSKIRRSKPPIKNFGKQQYAAPRLAARAHQRTSLLPASGSGYKEQPSSPRPKTAGFSIYTSVYKEQAFSQPKPAGTSIYTSVQKEQALSRPKIPGFSIYTSVYKEQALSRPKPAGFSIYTSVYKEQALLRPRTAGFSIYTLVYKEQAPTS
jgi:hypothetical protein